MTLCWVVVALLMGLLVEDEIGLHLQSPETEYTFRASFASGEFRPPLNLGTKTCGTLKGLEDKVRASLAPTEVTSIRFCIDRSYGLPVGGVAHAIVANTEAAGELAGKTIDFPIYITNFFRFADSFSLVLFLALSIVSLRLFRITPGKKLMGLTVAGSGRIAAFRREILRNLPHIIVVLGLVALNEMTRDASPIPPTVHNLAIALQVLALLAAIVLWIWPLLRWRGALPHDKWFAQAVVRTGEVAVDTDGPRS